MASTAIRTMTAAVVHEIGGPEVIKLHQWPIPTPQKGQVLIRVKAFGLNRSELYTRQGHSPGVSFPRILGIEAAGVVEDAPGNEFSKGEVVVTAMGGMGRMFDGGYAEYTCVPATQVKKIKTSIPWPILGALPEMLQTTWGSLFTSLRLEKGDRLLVRGGTTSIGLAAMALAKDHGAFVAATTRRAEREKLLRDNGADAVFVDTGTIAEEVKKRYPEGFNKILELVGVTTLRDSLRCAQQHGIVCMTGIAGGKWTFENFTPIEAIPTGVCLTTYASSSEALLATPVEEIANKIVNRTLKIPIKTYPFAQISEAHRCMEENDAGGKIVVLI